MLVAFKNTVSCRPPYAVAVWFGRLGVVVDDEVVIVVVLATVKVVELVTVFVTVALLVTVCGGGKTDVVR